MGHLLFFSLETWILLITFICIFVMYGTWTYGIFEKLGITGPKPLMYWGTIGRLNHVYYLDDYECAKKYGRVWGTYELRRPILVVMEPDMLKTILVKECFTYFTNRRNFRLNGDLYDAVNFAEDDQWRRIRNILSPSFTSGRLKEMFSIMKHHSRRLTTCLQSKAHNGEVINTKDFFGSYSVDVMASCAFNVDMNSISSPSSPLMTHASKLFRLSLPLFMFQGFFPIFLPLLELLGVSFFPKDSVVFFKTLVEKIRAGRNGSSDEGPVEYEAMMQMEYLDSVIYECLRLYPPAARLERTAKETVKINGITIPKDMIVMVPVYALHRDPELWPEPEEFKPDRFSKQNKQSINPYTYLPFGIGPRNCLGMRFALVLIKLALVEVLQNYSFSVCEETEIPLKMDPSGLVGPINPIKLKLVTRSVRCS